MTYTKEVGYVMIKKELIVEIEKKRKGEKETKLRKKKKQKKTKKDQIKRMK